MTQLTTEQLAAIIAIDDRVHYVLDLQGNQVQVKTLADLQDLKLSQTINRIDSPNSHKVCYLPTSNKEIQTHFNVVIPMDDDMEEK